MTLTVFTKKGTPITQPLPSLLGAYYSLYQDDHPMAVRLAEGLEAAIARDACNQDGCGKPLVKAAAQLRRVKGGYQGGIAAVCADHDGKLGRSFTVTIEGDERRVVLQSKVLIVLSATPTGVSTL